MDSSLPEKVDTESRWPEDLEKPNTRIIYDYTEKIFRGIQDNIASLNTRLGVTIGFSGLMLRFSLDLPENFPSCLSLKVAACSLVCVALCLALNGFLTEPTGKYVKADELLEDNYYLPEELLRLKIIDGWNEGIRGLSFLQARKNRYLNWSVKTLAVSSLCFGINIILDSFYG